MAVPKRRQSVSRSSRRRSHHARKALHLEQCQQCGAKIPSHVVCPECGNYQGRTIIETEE